MADVTGRARAKEVGYYPTPSGHYRLIEAGEVFDLVEGHDGKSKWFDKLDEPKAAAPAAKKAAKVQKAEQAEPETPSADDVA